MAAQEKAARDKAARDERIAREKAARDKAARDKAEAERRKAAVAQQQSLASRVSMPKLGTSDRTEKWCTEHHHSGHSVGDPVFCNKGTHPPKPEKGGFSSRPSAETQTARG